MYVRERANGWTAHLYHLEQLRYRALSIGRLADHSLALDLKQLPRTCTVASMHT